MLASEDIAIPKIRKNISSGEDAFTSLKSDVILARDLTPEEEMAVEQWDEFIAEHEEYDSWYVPSYSGAF